MQQLSGGVIGAGGGREVPGGKTSTCTVRALPHMQNGLRSRMGQSVIVTTAESGKHCDKIL
jgi:hypothetical protein